MSRISTSVLSRKDLGLNPSYTGWFFYCTQKWVDRRGVRIVVNLSFRFFRVVSFRGGPGEVGLGRRWEDVFLLLDSHVTGMERYDTSHVLSLTLQTRTKISFGMEDPVTWVGSPIVSQWVVQLMRRRESLMVRSLVFFVSLGESPWGIFPTFLFTLKEKYTRVSLYPPLLFSEGWSYVDLKNNN